MCNNIEVFEMCEMCKNVIFFCLKYRNVVHQSENGRWKLIQRMYEDFWKSWKEDYLNDLQTRTEGKLPQNLEVGDIVTIK